MPCIVGIICEYNPFHKGHKYQIDKIREKMPDATIIAIMSGSIVQRGEFAFIGKYERARLALECGVNAVFEIPYPYCGSTAEIFANAGVEIAHNLNCDYICFGIENEGIETLEKIALAIDSNEFENAIKKHLSNKSNGYITAKQLALSEMGFDMPKSANDILAIEYIRAIKNKKISLQYKALKRVGAKYNDTDICDVMSASAIRKHYLENKEFISVPNELLCEYERIGNDGKTLDYSLVEKLLHTFSLMNVDKIKDSFDSNAEIASLVAKAAKDINRSAEFMSSLSSKSLTSARIKRVLLYALFGINSVDFSPKFTFLLGADKNGMSVVSGIKKSQDFFVITKHADIKHMSADLQEMANKQYCVDGIHNTLLQVQIPASQAYKNKLILK